VRALAATLRIRPDTPFSLALAASFGFGPNRGRPLEAGAALRMAFVVDGLREQAAVALRQTADGALEAELHGTADDDAAERQLRRIFSLDHAGAPWLAVGERDPVIARLQREHEGLRPVLFSSPYEALVWAILSQRRTRPQARALRERLAGELGRTFELEDERLAAFPLPERLAVVEPGPGLEQARADRLRAVAAAAVAGRLDPPRLAALGSDGAAAALQLLPGIGPFWSRLVVVRALGLADALATEEPRLLAYVGELYGLGRPASVEEFERIAEAWRPYRAWAAVLVRYHGDRADLPVPARGGR
jgi:DNA-3-methyladenine glycosylase II